MPRVAESFDPQSIEWRHITDPNEKAFLIDFEYSLLGYDAENGRLDMLLRFPDNGGHCRRHRHIAATATLVLEGEQHVTETLPDGLTKTVVRKKGDYALAGSDDAAYGAWRTRGRHNIPVDVRTGREAFEYFDEDMNSIRILTIEEYVQAWNRGSVPGAVERHKSNAA